MTTNNPITKDDLVDALQPVVERLIRLEVYTKGIMGKLLAPEEIMQLEDEAAQAERLNQPSTAHR